MKFQSSITAFTSPQTHKSTAWTPCLPRSAWNSYPMYPGLGLGSVKRTFCGSNLPSSSLLRKKSQTWLHYNSSPPSLMVLREREGAYMWVKEGEERDSRAGVFQEHTAIFIQNAIPKQIKIPKQKMKWCSWGRSTPKESVCTYGRLLHGLQHWISFTAWSPVG